MVADTRFSIDTTDSNITNKSYITANYEDALDEQLAEGQQTGALNMIDHEIAKQSENVDMIERSKQIRKQHELMALKHKLIKLQARKQQAAKPQGQHDADTAAQNNHRELDEKNLENEFVS